eukprot:s2965_g4.t1
MVAQQAAEPSASTSVALVPSKIQPAGSAAAPEDHLKVRGHQVDRKLQLRWCQAIFRQPDCARNASDMGLPPDISQHFQPTHEKPMLAGPRCLLYKVQNRNVLRPFNGELVCCDVPGAS